MPLNLNRPSFVNEETGVIVPSSFASEPKPIKDDEIHRGDHITTPAQLAIAESLSSREGEI